MMDVDLGDLIDYLGQSRRHALDHPLHRERHEPPQVHVRGAGIRPRQADRRLQGRTLPRFGAGGRLPHRSAWLARTSVYDAAFERAGIVRVERITRSSPPLSCWLASDCRRGPAWGS